MENPQKEKLIDDLLVQMNNEAENQGCPIGNLFFNFNQDEEYSLDLLKKLGIEYSDLESVIRCCSTREYITSYGNKLRLTEEGQARAISVLNAKSSRTPSCGDIHIETLNANAPTQIGNYNKQDIRNAFQYLNEEIEKSDAPQEQKEKVRTLLDDLLKHPLTQTILGGALSLGTKFIGK
jgi:DNA-binding MarR family transcriptional regulator